jgi:hypothetical protein
VGNVLFSYDGHRYQCFNAINTSVNINAMPFVSIYNFNFILTTINATSQHFHVIHWHTNHWLYISTSMVLYIDEMYLHQYNSFVTSVLSEDGCFQSKHAGLLHVQFICIQYIKKWYTYSYVPLIASNSAYWYGHNVIYRMNTYTSYELNVILLLTERHRN